MKINTSNWCGIISNGLEISNRSCLRNCSALCAFATSRSEPGVESARRTVWLAKQQDLEISGNGKSRVGIFVSFVARQKKARGSESQIKNKNLEDYSNP